MLYLGLLLFTASPACQRWLAAKAADVLSEQLGTTVTLGNARLGLFNRVVLDDVLLLDQQGDTLLSAARLSAKMDPWQIMQGRIRVANVQLFGYDLRLRREKPDEPYNFQFVLDKFASQDTTHTPLDLAISSIVVRRGTLSHDLTYAPPSDHFSIAHVRLNDLNIQASINTLTDDSIDVSVNRLSFMETQSSLTLNAFRGHLLGTPRAIRLEDAEMALPNSTLALNAQASTASNEPWKRLEDITAAIHLDADVTPTDLAPVLPLLADLDQRIAITADSRLDQRRLDLSELQILADGFYLSADANGHLNLNDTTLQVPLDDLSLRVNRLNASHLFYGPILEVLSKPSNGAIIKPDLTARLKQLGDIYLTGTADARTKPQVLQTDFDLQTSIGNVKAKGEISDKDNFSLLAQTTDLMIGRLMGNDPSFPVDHITANADLRGSLRGRTAEGILSAKDLIVKGERLESIELNGRLTPNVLKAAVAISDDRYAGHFNADLQSPTELRFNEYALEQLQGSVALNDVRVHAGDNYYYMEGLNLAFNNDDHGHHLILRGDFIDAHADGHFRYAQLAPTMQNLLHQALPSLIAAPRQNADTSNDQINFSINLWDSSPLQQLTDVELQLMQPAYIEGSINSGQKHFDLHADFPHVIYGANDLSSVSLLAHQEEDSLTTFVTLQRMVADGPVDVSLMAGGRNDVLNALISWDDHNVPSQYGELSTKARFFKDQQQRLGAQLSFLPSQVVISDTIWNVHPSEVRLHDGIVDVNGFEVSQLGRNLRVNGRVSHDASDTLYADLHGINLQYVFGLIDFHDVEFAGLATGQVKAHNFYSDIAVDANLRVDQFTLNDGLLGQLYVTGGFGRKDERAIDLDAYIHEPTRGDISHVTALIKPGHEPGRGMDLDIQARHINTYFINHFTNSFLTDLQGQATGYAHLYGPFKQLDLEGDLALDTVAVTIDVLGTRYHTHGGDSVHLRPGSIRFDNIQLYDRHHGTDRRQHNGTLNGIVQFEHFKNLRYEFNVEAHDILGYDFTDFGDQTFYGTVFANGNVRLNGKPGQLNVDLQCHPTTGTVFTYNASSPETMTENEFITFKKATPEPSTQGETTAGVNGELAQSTTFSVDGSTDGTEEEDQSDMRINFDLDITPEAQMRLLMDPRSEDYITLYGNGHIRANFYNKGRFQMYGTYRVDHGTYRLSLQDFIRKDFIFQQGSTITFGGQPLKGDLNLQAVYTVPSVSLNDLTVGSNFSSSNVRVNCIMNIGGRAEQPQVSFDFDIPNVNEDEKQMVRSLISTEEERNMQVIYLLGIGRFYTYGLDPDQSQTNAAVQSLLSSTLSGQLNNFLSNAIGNGNWNFGTNLATGNQGWNEVDVEGMLSGRLLNNRLLINGTFGYRDTPIANTNFIGDFDVQWLLTPSGNLSLKAYSETNDRYFTKTALTTQGIGLQVKKDFNSLRELFQRKKR